MTNNICPEIPLPLNFDLKQFYSNPENNYYAMWLKSFDACVYKNNKFYFPNIFALFF